MGLIMCLFSLAFFIWFSREIIAKEAFFFDHQFSYFVYGLRTPWLNSVMFFITAFGNQFMLVFAALLAVLLALRKHRKEVILFCVAIAMGAVLNSSFKNLAQRPRPDMSPLVFEPSYSFPSGHAMNSFIFYALVAYFSYHFFRSKSLTVLVSGICGVLVLLIGFSRIYLGVHYLSDIIAGFIAGFWWFVTILLVERTLIFYRLFTQSE